MFMSDAIEDPLFGHRIDVDICFVAGCINGDRLLLHCRLCYPLDIIVACGEAAHMKDFMRVGRGDSPR